MDTSKQLHTGVGLVEVVVGVSLISAALVGVIAGFYGLVQLSLSQTDSLKATYLLDEGYEAVRAIRDTGWSGFSTLPVDTLLYLAWDSGAWEATTTPVVIDGMYRTLVIENAYRDAENDLAESGTLEGGARYITVSVAWSDRGATSTESLSFYVLNIFDE